MDRYASRRGASHYNWKGGARNYKVNSETECWEYQGVVNTNGYGTVTQHVNGRYHSEAAHKALYKELVGPIPEGLELDHLCRNRRCVNPKHLEPVTRAVNTQRGATAKLTEDDVRQLRALKGKMSGPQAIAHLKLNVDKRHVYKIWNNKIWKNI